MANDKLQELTSRLYQDGLAKGRAEGEKILEEAKAEAGRILDEARRQAEKTIADATRRAEDIAAKTASDVNMASRQALEATKADICSVIVAKLTDDKIDKAFGDEDFVRQVMLSVAKGFDAENTPELEAVLPESAKGGLENFVKTEFSKAAAGGIEVSFSKKIKGGLQIGPKDGGWFVSLTDDTFRELIREYLRPATRKMLFGE